MTAQKRRQASPWSRLMLLLFLHCSLLLRNASHTWVGFLEAKGQHFTPYSKRTLFPQLCDTTPFPFVSVPSPVPQEGLLFIFSPPPANQQCEEGCLMRSLLTPFCCQSQTNTFLLKETTCSFAFTTPACRKKSKGNSVRFVSKALFMFVRHGVKTQWLLHMLAFCYPTFHFTEILLSVNPTLT